MNFWAWLFSLFAPRVATTTKPTSTPIKPQQFKPTPSARIFPVWVARSGDEFQSFPKVQPGWAAICWSDEPFAKAAFGFNWDAWPSEIGPGLWGHAVVLAAARREDAEKPLHSDLKREDFILHEAGHAFLGVGADHKSTNTIMQKSNGPPTEKDREELRQAIYANVDAFRVVRGPPPT